jgi:tetratricopeptide (TPR) repeat protein
MKVRIQYRFLFKLLAVVTVVSLLLAGVHRLQLYRNSLQILAQARKASEGNNPVEAIRFYTQFLGLRRDSAEAQVELADIFAKLGGVDEAFLHYESALRIDPTLIEASKSIVKIAIDLGRHLEAKETLSTKLIPSDPGNAEYQWLLGLCEYRLGELANAEKCLARAVEIEIGNPTYAASLAELLRDRLNGADKGKKVLDDLVENASENSDAFLARGRYLLEHGRALASVEKGPRDTILESAWQDGLAADRLSPGTKKNVLFLVEVAIVRNRIAEAREIVRSTIEANPAEPEMYQSAARIELADRKPEAATQILKNGLQVIPGSPDLLFSLAQLQLDSGNLVEAEELVAELNSRKFREAPMRYLEARVLVSKGQWRQAATLLEQSRAMFDRSNELLRQADFLSAFCYRNLGNTDQEIEALQRALGSDPFWSNARESLANAFLRSGRIQESIAEFSQIVNQPNAPLTAGLSLARLLFVNGLGRNASGEDWDPLRRLLIKLEEFPQAANDLAIMRAELLVAEKQPEEAEAILETRLDLDSKVPELYQALIALQIRTEAWNEAERSLARAEECLMDSVTVRLERGRYLIRRFGKQVDVNELEQLCIPDADWDSKQKLQLAAGFAGYFLSLEDYERCKKFAKVVADSEEGQSNLSIHLLLFELALRSSDLTSMSQSLAEVKRIEGTGPIWRLGEAIRLSVEASILAASSQGSQVSEIEALFARAIEQLSEAATERPNWARIWRLKGEINDRRNNQDLALQSYLEAIRLGEQNPQLITRAISLLFQNGRFVEADEVVRKLQEQRTPFSSELTRMASQVSLELENFDRALTIANDWAIQSDQQEDHVWLAQIHSSTGKFILAEEEFRIAIDMDRAAPGPWVSLVQMFGRLGNRDAALKAIGEAASAIREEDRDIALAQSYQAIQDYPNATRYYKKVLETRPDAIELMRKYADFCLVSGQEATAEPILMTLTSETTIASEETQSWARRALALIIGLRKSDDSSTQSRDLKKSRDLLAINAKKGVPTNSDQRALAIILSTRSDEPSTTESISLFEQIIKTEPKFSLADNFLLANLYLRSGNWERYSRTMRSVLGNGGATNSKYVRSYAEALFNHKEIPESMLWIDRLKKLAPKELSTASIESQLLFQSRDYDRLYELVNSNRSQTEPDRLLWAAQIAESCGTELMRSGKSGEAKRFLDMARDSFTEIAKTDPKRTLALAACHARLGEMKESFEVLRNSSLPPDEVGDLIQGALQNGSLNADEARELIGVVQTVQAKHPKNVLINLGLGDLWSWVGGGPEADKAYQMALKVDPNNIPVLNNFAMMLALTGQQFTEANGFIERAINAVGPNDYLLDTRCVVRLASANIQGAEQDIRKALEILPKPDRFFHLAQVLASQGRIEDAKAAMKKAQEGGLTSQALHPLERKAFETLLLLTQPTNSKVSWDQLSRPLLIHTRRATT